MDDTTEHMTDNGALNQMVQELVDLNDFLAGKYDKVMGDANFVAISDTAVYLKSARPTAVKTVVTNNGPNTAQVRENGVLVAFVTSGTSCQLPLAGSGALNIKCASSQTANIAVATYTKT